MATAPGSGDNPQDGLPQNDPLIKAVQHILHGSADQARKGWDLIRRRFDDAYVQSKAATVLPDKAHFDDVISDFNKRLLCALPTFHGVCDAQLVVWVETLTINVARDVRRRHARDPQALTAELEIALFKRQRRLEPIVRGSPKQRPPGNKARIAYMIDALTHLQWLQSYLRYLTPHERECIKLRAEGLTNPQIADELAMPVTTVACHISRGVGKLVEYYRERMKREGGPDDGVRLV